jgi:hypothetical protein
MKRTRIKPIILLVIAGIFLFLTIYFGGDLRSFFTGVIALVCGLLGVLHLRGDENPPDAPKRKKAR